MIVLEFLIFLILKILEDVVLRGKKRRRIFIGILRILVCTDGLEILCLGGMYEKKNYWRMIDKI